MVGFDVRSMKENDLKDIIRLSNNISPLNNYLLFEKDRCNIIVAQLNDDVIGYLSFEILSNINFKDSIYINKILVDEMYRGLGVGHQLMLQVEEFAKSYGILSSVIVNDRYLDEEELFFYRQGFNLNSNRIYEKKYYN